MDNLLLNIDFKSLGAKPSSEAKHSQKNKDKYKRARQKIQEKRDSRGNSQHGVAGSSGFQQRSPSQNLEKPQIKMPQEGQLPKQQQGDAPVMRHLDRPQSKSQKFDSFSKEPKKVVEQVESKDTEEAKKPSEGGQQSVVLKKVVESFKPKKVEETAPIKAKKIEEAPAKIEKSAVAERVLSKYQVDKFQKVAERMAQINSTINEERKELAKDRIANKKEEEKPEADVFAGDKFVDLPVNDKLKQMLRENNFEELTNIQKSSIPIILANQNVVLKSETGSGKTLAYLVPLFEFLSQWSLKTEKISREKGTYCIIFSPTRELCMQIEEEIKKLLKLFYYVVCGSIMGGENPAKEKSKIRKGLTVIICTPGRFLYHLKNTASMNLSNLKYLIFDEADRMLDLGFEREMNECLSQIKKKCLDKFKNQSQADNYWSDSIKINFVSATLNRKIEALGQKLMENYVTVGFDQPGGPNAEESLIATIPKQIEQFYAEIPTQYRLLYLLSFIFAHQNSKCIIFVSNCELVNFIHQLVSNLDWNRFANRDFAEGNQEAADATVKADDKPSYIVAQGHVYKLHGDMDHSERKKNFAGFDKADHSVLICTDVASRGLDFKKVEWVVQYDLSSSVKDYVNRVGRTARIATSGSSLLFVMPQELKYINFMKKKHGIELKPMDRYNMTRQFEKAASDAFKTKGVEIRFKLLKNIEDADEQQESLHRLRQIVRYTMSANESLNLVNMAQIAKNSSTRAYTGHSAEVRHIFDINNLNLTEFARSFGLYKNVAQQVTITSKRPDKAASTKLTKKRSHKEANKPEATGSAKQELIKAGVEENQLYSQRLLKAKQKELEKKIFVGVKSGIDAGERDKMETELKRLKREVYVNEWKVEQRKTNFEKAKHSTGKKFLSEFL